MGLIVCPREQYVMEMVTAEASPQSGNNIDFQVVDTARKATSGIEQIKLKRCSKKECFKQCRHVNVMATMAKCTSILISTV